MYIQTTILSLEKSIIQLNTHDNLVYYRIPYSFIIYSICILGFVNLLKQKKYNILALLIVSIIYFYSLSYVAW